MADEYYRLGPVMFRALRHARHQWVAARMEGLVPAPPPPLPPPAPDPIPSPPPRKSSTRAQRVGATRRGKTGQINFDIQPGSVRPIVEEVKRWVLATYQVPSPTMGKHREPVFEGHYDERNPRALPRQARDLTNLLWQQINSHYYSDWQPRDK